MIGRVAGTITRWGRERGYFATDDDAETFEAELTHILLHQMAAFNSPVWFNVGFEGSPQMQSACFILSVEDNMESILELEHQGGDIFRGGSGSGINLSKIRGSMEPLAKGGTASGPVSFMRGADAWAGTIKSGGKTRRAAKMVVLDVDHPDIREFIWCKAKEEDKAAALRDAGFDMSIDGDGFFSIQYQNANNSVRVTDEFMRAVENDEDWHLIARTTGEPTGEPSRARADARDRRGRVALCRSGRPVRHHDQPLAHVPELRPDQRVQSVQRVHACRRLGVQSGIAEPHEVPPGGRDVRRRVVQARRGHRVPGAGDHRLAVELSDRDDRRERARVPQLGLGYANLGAYLMADGVPYDSDAGRGTAAAITALMTGRAYLGSARIAAAMGPYEHYPENRDAHNTVMRMHRDASYAIPNAACTDTGLLTAARASWDAAVVGRRRARLSQRAGNGAGTHGDDQLPDGLRHHRGSSRTSRW